MVIIIINKEQKNASHNMMNPLKALGKSLAHYLSKPNENASSPATCNPEQLAATLRQGDVLLVEGSSRFSKAVKYLTQSTWSHAALCISDNYQSPDSNTKGCELIEADVQEGIRKVPLSKYCKLHTRICRPVGLTTQEIAELVTYAESRLGHQYDLKNIFDLTRYLIHAPPVPAHWRRRMLALGSGDPTKAICSSLIAQAFQFVSYPILPEITKEQLEDPDCKRSFNEFLHIRHHSLFAPRDFDISPYFQIIKPTLNDQFDYHKLIWRDDKRDVEHLFSRNKVINNNKTSS